jgi:hypothetical protein
MTARCGGRCAPPIPAAGVPASAFLSAQYGFRDAGTPIDDYDARLTEDLAARMIAGGMTTRWPRPPSPRAPDNYGMHPGFEIASLTRYGTDQWTTSLSPAAISI